MKLHTIDTLKLNAFVDCVCDNNFSVLIIEGKASKEELIKCFNNIYVEYNFLLQNFESNELLIIQNQILYLEAEYNTIASCIYYLRQRIDPEIINVLRGYESLDFNPADQKEFLNQLDFVEQSVLPTWKASVLEARQELDDYFLQHPITNTKVNRQYFTRLIISISNFNKHHIDQRIITVSEFVTYLNVMKEAIELVQSRNQINLQ